MLYCICCKKYICTELDFACITVHVYAVIGPILHVYILYSCVEQHTTSAVKKCIESCKYAFSIRAYQKQFNGRQGDNDGSGCIGSKVECAHCGDIIRRRQIGIADRGRQAVFQEYASIIELIGSLLHDQGTASCC